HSRFDPHPDRFDFQSNPLAGFGQRSHVYSFRAGVATPGDHILSPVGPVHPTIAFLRTHATFPLEHDLLGRSGWIEVDVGEQGIAGADPQANRSRVEVMLTEPVGRPR